MKNKSTVTDERIQKIIKLSAEGLSRKEILEEVGGSSEIIAHIRAWARRRGMW